MQKTAFLLIFMSANLMYASAMTCIAGKKYTLERWARKRDQFSKKVIPLQQKPIEHKKFFIEPSLSAVLEQKIISIAGLCCTYPSLKDATMMISNLVRVNNFFNTAINGTAQTLDLVKRLSQNFRCSNMTVATTLQTLAAHHRCLMQESPRMDYLHCHITSQNLNKLKRYGFDVNFTYKTIFPTLLIQAINSRSNGVVNSINALINNGANINQSDSSGKNAIMWAMEGNKKELIQLFLDHPHLDVNYTDNGNYNLLHCCIKTMLKYDCFNGRRSNDYDFMLDVMQQLLEKGANPTIKNNSGETPLEYALAESGKEQLRLHYRNKPSGRFNNIMPQKIIDLLKQAELTFARKN
jgi:hypothetical protein